jgi:hypothetical protein
MEEIYKHMYDYLNFSSSEWNELSIEDKSKYKWIHQAGGRGGHFEFPERYWRLKTESDIQEQEEYIKSLPEGTKVNRSYFEDCIPPKLKHYFIVNMEGRYDKIKKNYSGDKYFQNKPSWDYIVVSIVKI